MDPNKKSGCTTKVWTGPDIRSVSGLALTVGDYEGWHYHYFLRSGYRLLMYGSEQKIRMYYQGMDRAGYPVCPRFGPDSG